MTDVNSRMKEMDKVGICTSPVKHLMRWKVFFSEIVDGQKSLTIRGGSRTAATSKMEHFVIIHDVNRVHRSALNF